MQAKDYSAEDALELLSQRWSLRRSVREVFLGLDADCDGAISPHELKASVDGMGVGMSGPEFRKLWRRLDGAGEGKLTLGAFSKVRRPRGRIQKRASPWRRPRLPRPSTKAPAARFRRAPHPPPPSRTPAQVVGPLIFPSSWGFASTMCV